MELIEVIEESRVDMEGVSVIKSTRVTRPRVKGGTK